jgi:acyl carrier protein
MELVDGNAEITADTPIADVCDSTAIMELVVWLEGRFGLSVDVDDVCPRNFATVRRLAAFVASRLNGHMDRAAWGAGDQK